MVRIGVKALIGFSLVGLIAANVVLLVLVFDIYAKFEVLQGEYNHVLESSEQVATKLKSVSNELEELEHALDEFKLANSELTTLLRRTEVENDLLRKEATAYADRASRSFE